MATVRSYVLTMQQRENVIAHNVGSDIWTADMRIRALNIALLAMIGTLVKVLIDKGVVTGAELIAVLDAAIAETWPAEPDNPPIP